MDVPAVMVRTVQFYTTSQLNHHPIPLHQIILTQDSQKILWIPS